MTDRSTEEATADRPLLEVEDLRTYFYTDRGTVRAVDGVSVSVSAGETVCLVGESGAGKSVTAESITRLIDTPPGDISGTIRFKGRDLTEASERELQSVRGDEIAHVFQNPGEALNPVYTAGRQVAEVLKIHTDLGKAARRERAVDLLDRVGLPNPGTVADTYPHELSGGQKQRVCLAIALAGEPDLLVVDEPTTALDVTVQAGILALLADLQSEFGMAILFVTHDLGVVAQVADEVVVLYAGKVMERGPVEKIFHGAGHPYTRALLACLPGRGGARQSIGGEPPSALDPPDGCRFAPRCAYAVGECHRGGHPDLVPVDGASDHVASCLFHQSGFDRSHIEGDPPEGGDALALDDGDTFARSDDNESPEDEP